MGGTDPRVADFERIRREFDCEHPETEVRRMTMRDGRAVYSRQCLRCGQNTGAVRQATLSGVEKLKMQPFDEDLRRSWQERWREAFAANEAAKNQAWWDRYNAYLETPEWKRRRRAVLLRDEGMCQGCRIRQATQVHHLTYERVGEEMLFDLVSICDQCHETLHREKK